MKCDCKDCGFRGMELCEHRKAMDEINNLKSLIKELTDALETQIDCDDDCGECEDCGSCPTTAFEWRKLVAKAREVIKE